MIDSSEGYDGKYKCPNPDCPFEGNLLPWYHWDLIEQKCFVCSGKRQIVAQREINIVVTSDKEDKA